MMQSESGPDAPPPAPGTRALEARPTTWPTVIGIISVILGVLALLQGLMGAIMAPLIGMIPMPAGAGTNPMAAFQDYVWEMVAVGLIGVVIAGIHILAGQRLLKRRVSARGLFFMFAILKMIYALASTWSNVRMQNAYMDAIANDPNFPPMPPGLDELMQSMTVAMSAFIVLYMWAYPIFLLVWFNRAKIRGEMATW